MTLNNFTDLAMRKASQSICRFRVAAVGLNYKGEIVGTSFNRPRFSRYGGGLHAERILIERYGNKLSTIILCRINRTGGLLPIHPCKSCQKLLDKMGIRVYSISNI